MQKLQRREAEGDLTFSKQYHALVDPLYELDSPEAQDRAFQTLYRNLFVDSGLGNVFDEVIRELPFSEAVDLLYFKMAASTVDVGADLMVRRGGDGPKHVSVLIPDQYLVEKSWLQAFLRHEFMHISDILDKTFQYEDGLAQGAPVENWIMDRYVLLWDIYIDGRLSRTGKLPEKTRDDRLREFTRLYHKIPGHQREPAFEWLWNANALTHPDILNLTNNPADLLHVSGIGLGGDGEDANRNEKINLPGMPCPLCHFPTYYWEDELLLNLEGSVVRTIQENHPQWTVEDGACPRCIEGYSVMAEAARP